jgi:hypothetical protein
MDRLHAERVRREVAVTGEVRADGWYRIVHDHSLGLKKSHVIPARHVRLCDREQG